MPTEFTSYAFRSKETRHKCPACGILWTVRIDPNSASEFVRPNQICPHCCPSVYKKDGKSIIYAERADGSQSIGVIKSVNDY